MNQQPAPMTKEIASATLKQCTGPMLMSIPHLSTEAPETVAADFSAAGQLMADTDWRLDRLYDFAEALDISVLTPRYCRYVIDLNRHPQNEPLYQGADNTGLTPLTTFSGEPIYHRGRDPDKNEVRRRLRHYWQPYHDLLQNELERIRNIHGYTLLFDCHSICSKVPRFFSGTLPDLNLGTSSGNSCAPELKRRLVNALSENPGYSLMVDGRFKGGYITRHYGKPDEKIHAFQMELSWNTYMEEKAPYTFLEEKAAQVRPVLRNMLETALSWQGKE